MMKSQSAMEYLMTYGWAILIIAVVLAVLFQLGVFSSGNFQPHAQAGACQVSRTVAGVSLEGQCNGLLPEFVAQFSQTPAGYVIATLPTQNPSQITISYWIDPVNNGDWGDPCGSDNDWQLPIYAALGGTESFDIIMETCNVNPNLGTDFDIAQPGYARLTAPSGYLVPNTWKQVTATFDGTHMNIYVDGQLAAGPASSNGNYIYSFNTFRISGEDPLATTDGGNPVSGYMANIQLYNISLSASEIQALYLEGIGGAPIRPQNIVGWWPLNGNGNDYSGNDNNGQLNSVTFSSSWENSYTAP